MRRYFPHAFWPLCIVFAAAFGLAADSKPEVTSGRSVKNDVSRPLREIPAGPLVLQPQHLQLEPLPEISDAQAQPDPVVQKSLAPAAMPSPILNFDGIGFPGVACNCAPPDTNGEVGATQYVQMVNEGIQVFDKTTGASVLGPIGITTLWSGFTGVCETSGFGDPVVLYDQLANRWVITQFAGSGVPTDECVAVSTSSDATGAFNRYDFHLGSNFFDYPKLSVWPDAYYLAENVFNAAGTAYLGPQPFAFDRTAMLAGLPATFVTPGLQPQALGFMLSADLDGALLPAAGAPNPWLSTEGATWALYRFHVDFGTPANSTFTLGGSLSPAGFTTLCDSTRSCVPQAGTTDKLDGIGDRPMFRLAYRRFGDGHEALVGNRTVSSSGVAGVRWWEINNATSGVPGFVQEGTYQPDTTWRWLGSAAMDFNGDLALGFSASSATIHPEIRYAGRLAGDPAGTLSQGEATLFAGAGSQTGTGSRWGDYSDLTVDPVDDCTFWYTSEYYATTASFNWMTRIGNFKFPGCTTGPRGTLQGHVTICSSGLPLAGATVSAGVAYSTVTDASGDYSILLPVGGYTVAITKAGFTTGGGPATITDGGTTIVDACLSGAPVIEADGATIIAESCSPGSGTPDPGETVTVTFCLKNTGGDDTTDLVATLGATGGVTGPSGPQSFGALSAGGASVCRDFVFTVDPALVCGQDVTATFALVDGAASLPPVAYSMQAGKVLVRLGENFDTVSVPALPPGWTAANATGPAPLWVTTATSPDTAPNAAFVDDPNAISDKLLDTPSLPITSAAAQLSFRNNYALESTFDGGVLEIAIGGGAFADILAAGGTFVTGGYVGTISTSYMSPIAGRAAWTGSSSGYITTVVNLPAAAAGQNVVLRFRMGSDSSVSATGWSIDTLSLNDGYVCCGGSAFSLQLDAHSTLAPMATGINKVLEPGESVLVEPGYFNGTESALALTGTASNFTGPAGAAYTLTDGTADYGSIAPHTAANCYGATGDCYILGVDNPAVRPAAHWDATFDELLSSGGTKTWTLHIGDSFVDVPSGNLFYSFIETIFHNGVTGGCGGGNYCPTGNVTRAQMAVFLLKGSLGSGYTPPACTGTIFGDVPCTGGIFDPWIENLAARGITGGCGSGNYCPAGNVTRAQMAVFLLKASLGSSYTPPACTGAAFGDVPCTGGIFDPWIEDLAARAITGGCGAGNYCPGNPNTRGQMAVFLTKTFGLLLYGP